MMLDVRCYRNTNLLQVLTFYVIDINKNKIYAYDLLISNVKSPCNN